MPQSLSKKHLIIEETDLLLLLKNKDKTGFDILYHNYAKALYGFINKMVKSESLANELLQQAFGKIMHDIYTYDASKTSFFAWMYVITRKLIASQIMSDSREETHLEVIIGGLKIAN